MSTSNFQPIRLLDPYLITNSVDPDQLASSEATDLDLHCLQRQDAGLGLNPASILRKSTSGRHRPVSDDGPI